jgi:hypothetical protein
LDDELSVLLKQLSLPENATAAGAPPLGEANQQSGNSGGGWHFRPPEACRFAEALRMVRRLAQECDRTRVAAKRRNSYDIHC